MSKSFAIFFIILSSLSASISFSFILLYMSLWAISIYHGQGNIFLKDISREYTPIFIISSVVILISSLITIGVLRRYLNK